MNNQKNEQKNKVIGLIGDNIRFSYSPQIHALLGEYKYNLWEIGKDQLDLFMSQKNFDAINVTIPFKKVVIPYLSYISPEASRICAVNTVVNHEGRLSGYNTDYIGFSDLLDINDIDVTACKVLILGNGGAAATVKTVMEDRKASETVIISRSGENNYTNLEKHKDAEIIVNTTPVGKYPHIDESPIESLDIFTNLKALADLTYNPHRTKIMRMAEAKGCKTAGGLTMLISQAIAAKHYFFSETGEEDAKDEVIRIEKQHLKNIILVGMPGCGKSSIGKLLAEKSGREFIDIDDNILSATNRTPAEIIKEDGEATFRKIENKILKENCLGLKKLIATGGGAVTTKEGRDAIRQGGCVVFIDRDISLLDKSDRPLSQGSLLDLYNGRIELYKKTADYIIDGNADMNTVAERIIKEVL